MRRWLHEVGWVWKRAKRVSKDHTPQRVPRLARIRYRIEQLTVHEAMVCANELDLHLWPKVGCAWMPKGTKLQVMTPGQHHKHDLAGALDVTTGRLHHCLGPRQTNAMCRDRLNLLEAGYPADGDTWLYVVLDNDKIHHPKAVEQSLTARSRVTRLCFPTYCPARTRLNPRLAMRMTAPPATIGAPASQNWWPMWRTISISTAPGNTSTQTSTMSRRSPQQWKIALPRNSHTLPPERINVVWSNLLRIADAMRRRPWGRREISGEDERA